MSVERLLWLLEDAGLEPTSYDVADALWLAVQLAPRPETPVARPGTAAPTQPAPRAPQASRPAEPPVRPAPSTPPALPAVPAVAGSAAEPHAQIHVPAQAGGDGSAGKAIAARAPAASPLPDAPAIGRALRPLKRLVPSRQRGVVLDEDATVDRVDRPPVLPVFRPAPERWLSLALVVDAGPSMAIWRSLIGQLREQLAQLGAFRELTTWYLHMENGVLGVRRTSAPMGPLRSPGEVVDPTGRQVILMVSDCVDDKWRWGRPQALLEGWGRRGPVAVVQPFPQRLWNRTGFPVTHGRLSLSEPGGANRQFTVVPDRITPATRPQGIAIPVLEIAPEWFAAWAQLITGVAAGGQHAIFAWTRQEQPTPAEPEEPPAEAPERVARFRAEASPSAYRLAGLLSAAPLTLPVMRLVQQAMLPDSRPAHLAEVFYSGLIYRAEPADDPEAVRYDFAPDVRRVLLSTIRRSEAVQIIERISAFIATRTGLTHESAALLTVPHRRGDAELSRESRPYAAIPAEVLRRLGGAYAELVSPPEPATAPPEPTSKPAPEPTAEVRTEPTGTRTARKTTRRVMAAGERLDVHAVVVGSGFGGSVAAYRLAEAGLSVVVMERGQAYPPGAFGRTPAEMGRAFWDPSEGLYGLFDVWTFGGSRGLDSIVSSGLGGGSLIYANVLSRKDEKWFVDEEPLPGGGYESWPVTRSDLDPHYDEVERMLGATPYPLDHPIYADTPKTHAMQDAAAELGLDWLLPPLAVSFAPRPGVEPGPGLPIADPPYRNLHGITRRTCRLCGECAIGCNDGSKNTLDHTYLSAAKHHGADIRVRHEVRAIRPRPGGGYEVDYVVHDPAREGQTHDTRKLPVRTIGCDRLILGAGTYGTSYLLLRNAANFPGISPALGTRFCGNGDLLAFLMRAHQRDRTRQIDASRGPVITSAIRLPDELDGMGDMGRGAYIEDAGYPAFADWMVGGMDSSGRQIGGLVQSTLKRFREFVTRAPESNLSAELAELIGEGALSVSSLPLLGMGRDLPDGVLRLRDGRLDAEWTTKTSAAHFERLRKTMQRMGDVLGAEYADQPMWFRKRIITVHPLGGAPMGSHPAAGVCDGYGEVYGFPGLYIADGAALPGPVGANPALTIAALADRLATRILDSRG